ncbi:MULTISPECIES: DUF6602 domain-containing protein [unclassified Streptomyces]|uniref:DUF6602 domain-containing protein n=1 Tax=unclassified Streptomyces TaxID=2593676 RepID=UPI00382AD209
MKKGKLEIILESVAKRMRADFDQSRVFNHNGEAGTSREILVQNFLSSYLPTHVEAAHNVEIITHSGDVSSQCDIAVVGRGTLPLTDLKGYQVIPNECVYGVVEVKTNLTRADLFDSCEKISKARKMEKTAYRKGAGQIYKTTNAYGRTYDYFPTSGIVVAFNSGKLETLGNHLIEWCSVRPVDEWPDSVWVLGEGYLQWRSKESGSLERTPSPGSTLVQVDPGERGDILLPLALHLNIHFSEAWMHPLDLVPYAGSAPLGVMSREWNVPGGGAV